MSLTYLLVDSVGVLPVVDSDKEPCFVDSISSSSSSGYGVDNN